MHVIVKQETAIASIRLNAVWWFANEQNSEIIIWSQLHQHSFTNRSTVCTKQDLGMKCRPSISHLLLAHLSLRLHRCWSICLYKTRMRVTAASTSAEISGCRRRFRALPVVGAARKRYRATRDYHFLLVT